VTGGDVHGDVWARGAAFDHAVNVATGGPPEWLRVVLREALDGAVAAYPDERAAAEAVAARHGREPEEVVLLNGAAQGFGLVAQVMGARRPVVVHPQFLEAERAFGRVKRVVLGAPFSLEDVRVDAAAEVVVVGNPTNPTGVLHPRAAVRALLAPGRVVVVDEAFMDFVPGEPESLAGAREAGLVVLRSLTKVLAVPGLRVGYLLAERGLARRLREARPAWSVNGLALAAVEAAARRPEHLLRVAERAQRDRAGLARALEGVARVHPGAAANFLLADVGVDALALARALREEAGIAIRPASAFPGLGPHHVRLTARGGADDARLVEELGRRAVRRAPARGGTLAHLDPGPHRGNP
jgi:histidinol-phosphate aminotransferase